MILKLDKITDIVKLHGWEMKDMGNGDYYLENGIFKLDFEPDGKVYLSFMDASREIDFKSFNDPLAHLTSCLLEAHRLTKEFE